MDFHSITDKFFVLDLPENLISTEAKQDSDLILHEYESVIPEVIKNLGNFNLSSCFLSEKGDQHSSLSNERRGQNLSWNKKPSSWRKLSDFDKKSDDSGIVGHKFNGANLKKVKEVEIKLINFNVDNFKHFTSFSSSYALDNLTVINNERFSIANNKNLFNNYNNNIPKTQTDIGKIIGSILKCNQKENSNTKESNSSKQLKYLNKYKIQDLYKINQIYKLENSLPTWYILCNYTISTNNNKNIINTNEFSMGPFSSECIVSFFKQGALTEDTKLKIDKSILEEEKTNSKLYALLNNQQGIKIKNIIIIQAQIPVKITQAKKFLIVGQKKKNPMMGVLVI
jgi:hypothetical protein